MSKFYLNSVNYEMGHVTFGIKIPNVTNKTITFWYTRIDTGLLDDEQEGDVYPTYSLAKKYQDWKNAWLSLTTGNNTINADQGDGGGWGEIKTENGKVYFTYFDREMSPDITFEFELSECIDVFKQIAALNKDYKLSE